MGKEYFSIFFNILLVVNTTLGYTKVKKYKYYQEGAKKKNRGEANGDIHFITTSGVCRVLIASGIRIAPTGESQGYRVKANGTKANLIRTKLLYHKKENEHEKTI